jgi:Family of unknown function (DUF5681)
MTDERSKDCEVGYGRPPKATRFAPGKSGNPRGRPKGSRSVGAILKGVMSQKVTVSEGGRMRRVSRVELMLLRLVNNAARGDPRATKLALELNDRYGQPTEGGIRSEELSADDREILAAYSLQARDPGAGQGEDQEEAGTLNSDGP